MTEALSDPRLLLLSPGDTVLVLRGQIEAGETVLVEGRPVVVPQRLGLGQKIARLAVAEGEKVMKYGAPIGLATRAIAPGDHVHLHNLRSDYTPSYALSGQP